MALGDGGAGRLEVQRPERAKVDDLGLDALGGELLRSDQRNLQHARVGDDRDVAAFARHARNAERHGEVGVVRHFALHAVQIRALQEDDRIASPHGRLEHPLRIGRCGRRGDHQAGEVRVERLERLRVLRGQLHPGALRPTDDHRDVDLSAGEVAHLRGVVEDLIRGDDGEVHGHHLHDRAQPEHGHPYRRPRHGGLGDGGVDDTPGAVLLQHPSRDAECAFVDADVLAHDEDVFVAIHLLHHRVADGIAVALLSHAVLRSAGAAGGRRSYAFSGSGPCSATTSFHSSAASGGALSSANWSAAATCSPAHWSMD